MATQARAVLVIIAMGLVSVVTMPFATAGSDVGHPVASVARMSTKELQLCREGSAETSVQPGTDGNTILQHYAQARAACDQLVDGSGLQSRDMADALLDRADLEAPGQDDVFYAQALAEYARAIALSPKSATAYWRRGKANLLYSRNLRRPNKMSSKLTRSDDW